MGLAVPARNTFHFTELCNVNFCKALPAASNGHKKESLLVVMLMTSYICITNNLGANIHHKFTLFQESIRSFAAYCNSPFLRFSYEFADK